MLQPAQNLHTNTVSTFVPASSREAAVRDVVEELSARYGHAVPAAIIDDVLAGTRAKLPRNADGSVSVLVYAEWHVTLGEQMERELGDC